MFTKIIYEDGQMFLLNDFGASLSRGIIFSAEEKALLDLNAPEPPCLESFATGSDFIPLLEC